MVISWGKEIQIPIDNCDMVLRPEFEASLHEWEGLLQRIRLKIFVKHEKILKNLFQQT